MGRTVTTAALGCCLALITACTSGESASSPTPRPTTAASVSLQTSASGNASLPASVTAHSSHSASPTSSIHPTAAMHSRTPTHATIARLPLTFALGSATQVITAVASTTSATQGSLQAWQRSGTGWVRVGPSVHAWFGSDGLSAHPSESSSATPIGSFTLTEAFGHDANPGASLPYRQTTPSDWWISQAGPLYNTEQHCSSGCSFTQGNPNEHLYYETPYYDYAVVIDYNRFPVRQGAGSAFFLHVTVGAPTAGCVSIDKSDLVRILRWLRPSAHPRMLIGLG